MTASQKSTAIALGTTAVVVLATLALVNGRVPFVPTRVSTALSGLVGKKASA